MQCPTELYPNGDKINSWLKVRVSTKGAKRGIDLLRLELGVRQHATLAWHCIQRRLNQIPLRPYYELPYCLWTKIIRF